MASEEDEVDDEDEESESLPAVKRVVAEESDGPLGVLLSGVPPGYVDVTDVKKGSWADRVGLSEGDVLIEVNDEDLEDMTAAGFKSHFMGRPLSMTFQAASGSEDEVEAGAGKESEDDNEVATKSLFASNDVKDLGLQLNGSPPGYLQVAAVQPQSLAWSSGIQVGDFLVEVNGSDLESMTAKTFFEHYNGRPLKATFQHPQASSDEDEKENELARLLQPAQLPPKDEQMADVAEAPELESGGVDPEPKEDAGDTAQQAEAQEIGKASPPKPSAEAKVAEDPPASNENLPFEKQVMAEEADGKLGLILSGMPPGYLEVTGTREGSWAERVGLVSGDLLFCVNGQDLENMAAEEFKGHLMSRPLNMRFQAADQGSDPPTDGQDEAGGAEAGAAQPPEKELQEATEHRAEPFSRVAEQDDQPPVTAPQEAGSRNVEKADSAEAVDVLQAKAALKIQSSARGKAARMEVESRRKRKLEAEEAERQQKEEAAEEEVARQQAALKIQSMTRGKAARKEAKSKRQQKQESEEAEAQRREAAVKIQSAARGKAARTNAKGKRQQKQAAEDEAAKKRREEAALQIQKASRGKTGRRQAESRRCEKKQSSALAEQRQKDEAARKNDPLLRELAELHTQLQRVMAEAMELRRQRLASPAYELQLLKQEVEAEKARVQDLERAYIKQTTLANAVADHSTTVAADLRREYAAALARSSLEVEEAVQAAAHESRRIGQQHWECMRKAQEVAELQCSSRRDAPFSVGHRDRLVLEEVTALLSQLRHEEDHSYQLSEGMEPHAEEMALQKLQRQLQSEKVAARKLAKSVDAELAVSKGLDLLEVRCERLRTSVWSELPEALRSGLAPKRAHEAEDRIEACHLHALVLAEEASAAGAQRQAGRLSNARHELAEQEQEVERLRVRARLDRGSRNESWQETIRYAASDEAREEARLKREFRSMRASNRLLTSELQEQVAEKRTLQLHATQQAHAPEATKTKRRGWFG